MGVMALFLKQLTDSKYALIVIFVFTFLLNNQTCFALTEKQIEGYVMPLVEASAVLNVCFESQKYKTLTDEQALSLFGLNMRIEDLVQELEDYFNESDISLVHGIMSMKMSSDPQLIEYVKSDYQYCSDKLIDDMDIYISNSKKKISKDLPKN